MDKKVQHIALFLGSFNPIHLAHLSIARSVIEKKLANEVWFVVSPQNPHKSTQNMAPAELRLKWVETCLMGTVHTKACDIELHLPQPSYTINTIEALQKHDQNRHFSILMGEDNLEGFKSWKTYQTILKNIQNLLVYPRKKDRNTVEIADEIGQKVIWLENPLWPISATEIREKSKTGASLDGLIPHEIEQEVRDYYKSH